MQRSRFCSLLAFLPVLPFDALLTFQIDRLVTIAGQLVCVLAPIDYARTVAFPQWQSLNVTI